MATVREHFDTDVRAVTLDGVWTSANSDGTVVVEVNARIAQDIEANAKYWYIFIPATADLYPCLSSVFASDEFAACRLGPEGVGVTLEVGHSGYSERLSSSTLQFTKRVHLYLDFDLTSVQRSQLVSELLARGYYLSIRDREYARTIAENQKPLAFISHDSRDKDAFVRELAHELSKNMCPVWYDEFSLKVGDSLRENIERGLKETKKCIVVLSPSFLSNKGWGRAEFDSVFARERLEEQNIILPVWLNVEKKDVYDYSPRLADRLGLSSNLGVVEVARRLSSAVKAVV